MIVFVLDTKKIPQNPITPTETRLLLKNKRAAIFKRYPFTIILKNQGIETPDNYRLKIDPGSKTSGIAILAESGEVIFAANLEHHGHKIKKDLESRRALRMGRRSRKTRYREPRFNNRKRPKGWLPPSLKHRVYNIETWVRRLRKICNITAISMELNRFDTQKMENPEISGVEYQQGDLAGYNVREYLLEKWGRKCAYCDEKDVPLEVEHIVPKSRGGSDRISNLTLACNKCNIKKGNKPVEIFLKNKPDVLKRILAQAKRPLKDAAAVNTTRWDLYNSLKKLDMPIEVGSGALTKFNRCTKKLPKDHWIDAACVGKSTPDEVFWDSNFSILNIKSVGHGSRKMCQTDKYGFRRKNKDGTFSKPKGSKFIHGFQTGDIVRADVPPGKKTSGIHTGRLMVRANGTFDMETSDKKVCGINWKYFTLLQKADGYNYHYQKIDTKQF